jgi:hypothetical protein
MFSSRFFRKILHPQVENIDQSKLVYILSFVAGFLSTLAVAPLKNKIYKTSYYEKGYYSF